jgi:hypothetical protein
MTAPARCRAWHALLLCAAIAAAPVRARAFSDPATFQNDVAEGGGGGRFFTGSPADGYTCNVCHRGAESPDIEISGLPLTGYTPGTAYEITIDWPDDFENVALALELDDAHGKAVGRLRLPPQDELLEPERCVPVSAGIAAGQLVDAEERSILEVPNCGAQRVRFLWVAPAQDHGAVWFAGSLVRADGMSDVAGDGVTNFSGVLASPSQSSANARAVNAGCNVARAASDPGGSLAAGWLLITVLLLRRHPARRSRRRRLHP